MAPNTVEPRITGMGWLSWGLLGVAALSALCVIFRRDFGWPGFPNTASTTLCLLLAVAGCRRVIPAGIRWSVVAGLGCSALGDAFLMARKDYFIEGLASFLVAHLCYLWALTRDSRWAAVNWPFLFGAALGLGMLAVLWPGIAGSLRIPVAVYAGALLAMAAQAASRAVDKKDIAATLAALGAAFFVASDSILAFQRFRQPLAGGHILVLGTYFIAQAGIALGTIWRR